MPTPYRLLLVVLLVASGAGCASNGTVAETEPAWSEGVLRDHLQQLTAPVAPADSAQAVRRVLYAARRMRRSGLMPAREPSFLLRMGGTDVPASPEAFVGPAQAHVLGYVTGRHPSHYDELVLVAADLNGAGAAAALEVARALEQEALYTQTPERTVLFALWAPPRTGAQGLADFLANPTWDLSNVRRALLVAADSAAVTESRRRLEAHGIPAHVVAVEDRSVAVQRARPDGERVLARTVRLTEALYARTIAAATARDTTATLPDSLLAP